MPEVRLASEDEKILVHPFCDLKDNNHASYLGLCIGFILRESRVLGKRGVGITTRNSEFRTESTSGTC